MEQSSGNTEFDIASSAYNEESNSRIYLLFQSECTNRSLLGSSRNFLRLSYISGPLAFFFPMEEKRPVADLLCFCPLVPIFGEISSISERLRLSEGLWLTGDLLWRACSSRAAFRIEAGGRLELQINGLKIKKRSFLTMMGQRPEGSWCRSYRLRSPQQSWNGHHVARLSAFSL